MKSAPMLQPLQQRLQSQLLLASGIDIESLIVADDIAGASERLDVYAQAYRLRLLEVLRNDYPVLLARVGTAKFEALGRSYIDAHPSDTPSVRWFGRHLSEHLRVSQPKLRNLSDLAAFEWSQGEVFDAPDAPLVRLEAMAQVPPDAWGEMRMLLHPSVRHLLLTTNAPALAGAHGRGEPLPRSKAGVQETWLLWRQDHMIHWRAIGVEEAAALDAVRDSLGFGDLCERLCEWIAPEVVAMAAAGLLKRWISDQLITELEFK